jgi:hypothetical protein
VIRPIANVEIALSVRSYPAFTSRSAPRELVGAAWRHILGLDARKLGDREFVGIVVAPLPEVGPSPRLARDFENRCSIH